MTANWKPKEGSSFPSVRMNDPSTCEQVSFIPDVTILCNPPYIKGKPDCQWITYLNEKRPKTKSEWEEALGMSLQTML